MSRWYVYILILLIVFGLLILGFVYLNEPNKKNIDTESISKESETTNHEIEISNEIENNKFGFLTGAPDQNEIIISYGGRWTRPHPGPFLWDSMQSDEGLDIDFELTDEVIISNQLSNLGTLVTLWPFANWDIIERGDADLCKVSDNDEFLPKKKNKPFSGKEPDYLPEYRCNPNNWEKYSAWITAVIERYDGDGVNDMPGLEIPVKYWEVMNEPDLTPPDGLLEEENHLTFYKDKPSDYAELLVKTYTTIKSADPDASVLIAGAAGGENRFLDFYEEVFKNTQAKKSFDIGNIHCISNDDYESFNVAPYKDFLLSQKIMKPIWVTEAEAVISNNPDINASQLISSTNKAISLGAEKIFYTRMDFEVSEKDHFPPEMRSNITPEISGDNPVEVFRNITNSN